MTGEGNATLTTGPATSPTSTPAASVTPQPTAPPTATLAPATANAGAHRCASSDRLPQHPQREQQNRAAVLWRLGGAKDVEDAPFTDLGGLDVAGEPRRTWPIRFGGVRIYDLAGEYQGLISAGEIGYITDVKAGPDGTVYIADAALHQITMFNADLDLLGGFGATGPGEGEFGPNSPAALAVSPGRGSFCAGSQRGCERPAGDACAGLQRRRRLPAQLPSRTRPGRRGDGGGCPTAPCSS